MDAAPDIGTVWELLQGGGNIALGLACYFIYRAEQRLSRIEKGLDLFLQVVSKSPTLVKEIRERLRADG